VLPPKLSNPKTPADADQMIAWENRDIAAQQEYVERLKKQLETAPPDQQKHLEDTLQNRIQVIADTQKERDGLITQKQALEKKPSSDKDASASQHPSEQ
jgi:hypothetical protein